MTRQSMTPHFDNDAIGGGRYQLVERIAGGAMGDVWRAIDTLLGRQIAIKLLKSNLGADDSFLERFRHEAMSAASLSHPAIATVYDYGEEQGNGGQPIAYIVMELVDGESLNFTLRRKGPLSPREALGIIGQTAQGLQAAHELGIVHRDIKPANLLIRPDGMVKITDFGIARASDDPALTQTGVMLGTVQYMSPEQLRGHPATPASDIYALGVVAFVCITGHTPFPGEESMAVALAHIHDIVPPLPPNVPADLSALVRQMLEKSPALRPISAQQVAERVRALTFFESSRATTPTALPAVAHPTGKMTATSVRLVSDPTLPVPLDEQLTLSSTAIMSNPSEGPAFARRHPARRMGLLITLALVAALVLVLLVVLLPSVDPPDIRVPNLLGAQSNVAIANLERAGLHVHRRSVDGTQPAGLVESQRPTAGKHVAEGSRVDLRISSGFVALNASRFGGELYAQAAPELSAMGLIPTEMNVISPKTVGTVLSIAPVGRVKLGTTVSVSVATRASPSPGPPAVKGGSGHGHGKGHDH
jgi:serine/threonine protein kinase